MRKIAIFASGSGTNAENIIKYFSNRQSAKVELVLSNKREAFVLKRATVLGVKAVSFERRDFYDSDKVFNLLRSERIDFIALAGFLWLIPDNIINFFKGRIVNIHPALLPAYGGKNMYGERVHRAVIENREKESGITIHYVNQAYDEGEIIFRAKCSVEPSDTPDTLAGRIHALEYEHYPRVIEEIISTLPPID